MKKTPHKVLGAHRPNAPGYHPHRAIHGSSPPVRTVETKTAPKAPKPGAPHTKKFKVQ
jgi:hypothetical protein